MMLVFDMVRSIGAGLGRVLPVLLIAVTIHSAHAQAFVFPADDPELREQVEELLEQRRPLIERITPGDAAGVIDELHELYGRAVSLAPGLGAILARDLSRAYDATGDVMKGREWMARSSELVEEEPTIRGFEREQQSAGSEISASMSRAQDLQTRGELRAAAEEFAYASSLLHDAPEDAVRPYLAYQLEFQYAMLLDKLGRKDDAYRAFMAAEYHLGHTDRYNTDEGVMLRVFQLETSPAARESRDVYRERLAEIYADPGFTDVPKRISIVGNRILLEAFNASDFETIEWIAEDIFSEVARFEEALGKEQVAEIGIHESYISAASVLAGFYMMDNRWLDAAATLEHTLHAYPDVENMHSHRKLLKQNYEELGILPDERTGPFAGPMSVDEYLHLRNGGTLPTSWDQELGPLPQPASVVEVAQDARESTTKNDASTQLAQVQGSKNYVPLIVAGGLAALLLGGVVWRRQAA